MRKVSIESIVKSRKPVYCAAERRASSFPELLSCCRSLLPPMSLPLM